MSPFREIAIQVAAVALLGSGSLGSAVGGDGAVGAVVPRWPALMGERVASDSAGSTTSDLSRPSGERERAGWRCGGPGPSGRKTRQ